MMCAQMKTKFLFADPEITVNMDRLGQGQQLGWLPEPVKEK